MRTLRLCLVLTLALAALPLAAQPPIGPDNGNGSPPDGPIGTPGDNPLPEDPALIDPYELHRMVREEVGRQLEDFVPLRSRRRLFLEFGGGLVVKYRQAQRYSGDELPDGSARAPSGFGLDRAWINVWAAYSDLVESEVELRFNGNYSLLNEDMIEVPNAWVLYNRPISQFTIFPKGVLHDGLLFGVTGHFFRQNHGAETLALGQRAFQQDEVIQARYTLRVFRNFYMVGALSDGTLLGRGQVDDSNNYPLLADDKTRYWRGLGNQNEVSRYLQVEMGAGFFYDFNAVSFLNSEAPFLPERVAAQNTNFIHVQAWGTIDQLSRNELALIEGMQRVPFKGGTPNNPDGHIPRSKWRLGANVDFGFRLGDGDLFVHGHFIHAEDGRFVRNAWGVEMRYSFSIPRIPFILRITPIFRYSELITNNNDNPLDPSDPFAGPYRVSSGGVSGFSLADAAGFAADRRDIMVGFSLTLARNVNLGFEVVFNDEDFKQTRSLPNDVPNILYLLRIGAMF